MGKRGRQIMILLISGRNKVFNNEQKRIKYDLLKYIFLFILLWLSHPGKSQDTKSLNPENDAQYFDFWKGTWYIEKGGKPDTASNYMQITQGVNPDVWKEEWRLLTPDGKTLYSSAIRAWDKTNNKWMFVWISDNGLFQIWEGRKYGDDWYICRDFDVNGDKYLSRQGFIPVSKNRVMRISEKSHDNGKTWELRFKEYYVKQ